MFSSSVRSMVLVSGLSIAGLGLGLRPPKGGNGKNPASSGGSGAGGASTCVQKKRYAFWLGFARPEVKEQLADPSGILTEKDLEQMAGDGYMFDFNRKHQMAKKGIEDRENWDQYSERYTQEAVTCNRSLPANMRGSSSKESAKPQQGKGAVEYFDVFLNKTSGELTEIENGAGKAGKARSYFLNVELPLLVDAVGNYAKQTKQKETTTISLNVYTFDSEKQDACEDHFQRMIQSSVQKHAKKTDVPGKFFPKVETTCIQHEKGSFDEDVADNNNDNNNNDPSLQEEKKDETQGEPEEKEVDHETEERLARLREMNQEYVAEKNDTIQQFLASRNCHNDRGYITTEEQVDELACLLGKKPCLNRYYFNK